MSNVADYKCPCCDGALSFDSGLQKMKCPYCDNTFDVNVVKEYNEKRNGTKADDKFAWDNYDKNSGSGDWREGESLNRYICQNCGSEIVTDVNTAATNCPYCGNVVVLKDRVSGMYRPDFIIPFKLDKEIAKAKLWDFSKGKFLLPKFYRVESSIDKITGVYVPFWLFNCDTHADINFKATRHTSWSDSKYHYTRTDNYLVSRSGNIGFDNVPVDGSTRMDDSYMEAVEPFDYSQLTDFQMEYLAGYIADKYDVDAPSCIPRANERIKNSTISAFRATAQGYDSCVVDGCNINFKQGAIGYALMPVWMLNTVYKGKTYTFAMNGQTGKLIGELPVSKGRFWGLFAAISGGMSLLGILIAMAVGLI